MRYSQSCPTYDCERRHSSSFVGSLERISSFVHESLVPYKPNDSASSVAESAAKTSAATANERIIRVATAAPVILKKGREKKKDECEWKKKKASAFLMSSFESPAGKQHKRSHKRSLSVDYLSVPHRAYSLPPPPRDLITNETNQSIYATMPSLQPSLYVHRKPVVADPPMFQKPENVAPTPLDASDLHTYEQGWSRVRTTYVRRMGERAGGFRWMHAQAAKHFTRWFNGVGYTAIIANALATAGNIPYVANCQNDLNAIKWVAIVLGFLVTVVMTFQQFRDFGSRRSEHFMAEQSYSGLYESIRQEVQKNTWERQDAEKYIEWISKDFTELKLASPLIPGSILDTYRQKIAGTKYADPENIDEIIVKEDSPDRVSQRRNNSNTRRTVEAEALITSDPTRRNSETGLTHIVIERYGEGSDDIPRAGRLKRRSHSVSSPEMIASDTRETSELFLRTKPGQQVHAVSVSLPPPPSPPPPSVLSELDKIAMERWSEG